MARRRSGSGRARHRGGTGLKSWYALELAVAREAAETVSSALWEMGIEGIVEKEEADERVVLQAFFAGMPDPEQIREALAVVLEQFAIGGSVEVVSLVEVQDEDWLARWKESWQPFTVGERFLVAPSWAKSGLESERLVIELDPGMAFGTGTHETTQLCLQAIERYWRGGRMLDVGTGTGILAIAAALMYPEARIDACDNDPEAVLVAVENAQINRVADRINFQVGSASDYCGSYELVVANLTAEVILAILDDLLDRLAEHGVLVLSGILDTQSADVCRALEARNFHSLRIQRAGEWVSIHA